MNLIHETCVKTIEEISWLVRVCIHSRLWNFECDQVLVCYTLSIIFRSIILIYFNIKYNYIHTISYLCFDLLIFIRNIHNVRIEWRYYVFHWKVLQRKDEHAAAHELTKECILRFSIIVQLIIVIWQPLLVYAMWWIITVSLTLLTWGKITYRLRNICIDC